MTDLLTTRDALAKALWAREFRAAERLEGDAPEVIAGFYEDADALLASGVVIDAAALAEDEALRWDLADKIALAYEGEGEAWPGGDRLATVAADIAARHFTRALAAALSGRTS